MEEKLTWRLRDFYDTTVNPKNFLQPHQAKTFRSMGKFHYFISFSHISILSLNSNVNEGEPCNYIIYHIHIKYFVVTKWWSCLPSNMKYRHGSTIHIFIFTKSASLIHKLFFSTRRIHENSWKHKNCHV